MGDHFGIKYCVVLYIRRTYIKFSELEMKAEAIMCITTVSDAKCVERCIVIHSEPANLQAAI